MVILLDQLTGINLVASFIFLSSIGGRCEFLGIVGVKMRNRFISDGSKQANTLFQFRNRIARLCGGISFDRSSKVYK